MLGAVMVVATVLAGSGGPVAAQSDPPAPTTPGAWNPVPAVPSGQSYLYLESEPGDVVGGGQTLLATSSNSLFTSYGYRVRVTTEHSSFVVELGFPASSPPPPGQVQTFEQGALGNVSVSSFTTCSLQAEGWAVVDHVVWDETRVTELDARVEQSCLGGPPLRAEIRWRASDATLPPGPPAVPSGLWDVPMPVVQGDNAMYLESAPGEHLAAAYGRPRWTFLSGDQFRVSYQDQTLSAFTTLGSWHVRASHPIYMDLPTVGLYRWSKSGGVVSGELSASYGNLVCGEEGWFAIDSIRFEGRRLTSLVMRFEERCAPGAAPLRGKIVFNAPADTGARSPIGYVDALDHPDGSSTATLSGWVLDPDTARPTQVHVYAGTSGAAAIADQPRPDVAAAYRFSNSAHGFTATVAVPPGATQVCAYGIDVGGRSPNALIGCKPLTGTPYGHFDGAYPIANFIGVQGWAIDPDTTSPTHYRLTIDGVPTDAVANESRPDLARIFGLGDRHGFNHSFPTTWGRHQVCITALNRYGPQSHTSLGCRTVNVGINAPTGHLDDVTRSGSTVRVQGWALDPDQFGATQVHIYVDDVGVAIQADRDRPDVGAALPFYGSVHGYDTTIPLPDAGPHRVCAYAINSGAPGANSLLGCRSI